MNTLQALAGFILPLLLGLLSAACLLQGRVRTFGIFYFISIGVGIGTSSLIFFLSIVTYVPLAIELGIEVILVAILGYVLFMKVKREPSKTENTITPSFRANWLTIAAVTIVCAGAINSSFYYFAKSGQNPNGGGDAYHIWNLKARFLASENQNEWKGMFAKTMSYSNPDYPLLLPGFIARNWKITGQPLSEIPIFTQFLFAAATAGLLFFGLSQFKSVLQASLGTLFLISTPFFLDSAANQFADLATGFFFLATIVLLMNALSSESKSDPRTFIAIGVTSGMAMWTKNEGVLFFISLLLLIAFLSYRTKQFSEGKKRLKYLFLGVLPFILILFYFKLVLAPVNELITTTGASTFEKLADISRYKVILIGFWKIIPWYGHWIVMPVPIALIYLAVMGLDFKKYQEAVIGVLLIILPVLLAGYFFIYLNTYLDVAEHLYNSFDRLLLQLTPLAIFVFFLAVRTPEDYLRMCDEIEVTNK